MTKRVFIVCTALVLVCLTAAGVWAKGPKNIVLLISDGCGYNQVDAASLYQYGATGTQVYEDFPLSIAMTTYASGGGFQAWDARSFFEYAKQNPTDSAAAATAMSCGVKTYSGAIGKDVDGNDLTHIIDLAEARGMATGVITSVEWTHATPAAFVAHNVSRNNYADIGAEMVNDSGVDVIMGCGHPWFDRNGQARPAGDPNTFKYVGGEPTWNALVAGTAGADANGDGQPDPWTLIQERAEFQALATGDTPDRVLGTARVYQTLQQGRTDGRGATPSGDPSLYMDDDPYQVPLTESVPTLEEMTRAALNVLDNDEDGFFLMVEGGAVDWASHANESGRVIEEEIDFNRSVEAVVDWVEANSSWNETLVIVTGDHETGYLTGPGSGLTADGPAWTPLVNNGAYVLPGMEWHSNNHTNALIPFYAKGDMWVKFWIGSKKTSYVNGKVLDNTQVAHIIMDLLQ